LSRSHIYGSIPDQNSRWPHNPFRLDAFMNVGIMEIATTAASDAATTNSFSRTCLDGARPARSARKATIISVSHFYAFYQPMIRLAAGKLNSRLRFLRYWQRLRLRTIDGCQRSGGTDTS